MRLVARAGFPVDRIERVLDSGQPLVQSAEAEPFHILEQKRARLRLGQHAKIMVDRRGARIGHAPRLAACPEPRLRERLAGRSADQDVGLARRQACRGQHLACRHRRDIAGYYGPSAIEPQGRDAAGIHLDRDSCLEAGRLEAEVQTPSAGEKAYCLQLSHQPARIAL